MLIAALGFTVMLAAAEPASAGRPSVVVVPLAAMTGVTPAIANVVTNFLVDETRRTGAFGRVVSARELEDLMGLEQQRQVLDCNSDSCMAEIAGSLNVKYLLRGSMARLGESFVLTLSLVDTAKATSAASAAERVRGTDEDALLDAVKPCVRSLLAMAFGEAPPPPSAPQAAAPVPPSAPPSSAERPVVANGEGGLQPALALGGAAAVAVPIGVVAALLAGAAGTVALALTLGIFGVGWRLTGLPFFLKAGLAGGSGVVGAAGGLLTLVAIAAGVTLAAAAAVAFVRE